VFRRFRGPLLGAAVLSIFAIAPARAQTEAVTATYALDTLGSRFSSFGWVDFPPKHRGQTFTAEVAGQLTSVSLRIGTEQIGPTIIIGIHTVDQDGLPVDPPLTSKEFPSTLLPSDQSSAPVQFDFGDAPTNLAAGEQYAITVKIDPLVGLDEAFFLNGPSDPTYAGGQAIDSLTGTGWRTIDSDHGFEVRVDTSVSADEAAFGRVKAEYVD
jgi:hypothetical protein